MPAASSASSATSGRRARRSAEIRERLFQAADELFMTRGLQATTVMDITDRADVGKGTFFNYFPTQEHVLTLYYQRQLWMMDAALKKAKEGVEPLQKTIADLVRGTSQQSGESEAMTRSFLLATLGNPAAAQMIAPVLQKRRNTMEQMWALGQACGEVRRDRSPATLARIAQEMSFGTALFWVLDPTTSLVKLIDDNFALFWANGTPRSERRASGARASRKRARAHSSRKSA